MIEINYDKYINIDLDDVEGVIFNSESLQDKCKNTIDEDLFDEGSFGVYTKLSASVDDSNRLYLDIDFPTIEDSNLGNFNITVKLNKKQVFFLKKFIDSFLEFS